MANQGHIALLLKQGIEQWNEWREEYRGLWPDLSGANLSNADLGNADLSGADLSGADLSNADLIGAYLSKANLSNANLRACLKMEKGQAMVNLFV